MVTLTIDGQTVEVPEGTTVLNAARKAGIEIPTLCDHPELTPYGGCRLCLVEIEGARTLQTSCTIPVTNNMVVRTDTEKVKEAREFVLTLLFSERNHFCMYCQVSGGDCELQNAAYGLGMTHWPLQANWTPYEVDASHPYFVLDHNRCILCRRCVRACGELVGNYTLGFEERGAASKLIADIGVPLGESSCVSCGVCLQVCPTGALIDRWSAYRGLEASVESRSTICPGCSVGCTVDVISRDNNLVRIEGAWDGPVNRGVLCEVGRFKPMVEQRARLHTPLVRKNGALKAATWDEAMKVIADRLAPLAGKNGSGLTAVASTRLPAEVLYQFKQVFGGGLVTTTEESALANLAAAAEKQNGPFEATLEDLKTADLVIAFGDDLTKSHQVAGFFVKRRLTSGLKLVTVAGEANGLDVWADCAVKASKTAGVLRTLNAAAGGQDAELAKLAAETGVDVETYKAVAEMIGKAEKSVLVFGNELVKDEQSLNAALELAKVSGARVLSVKGGANSLAALQYRLDQPIAVQGKQAAYVLIGDEEPSERLIQKLEGVPFLVVQSSYASKLTGMADVVLPVETWLEHEGHYVSLDGRIQAAQKTLQAPPDVRSNLDVLVDLAGRLGIATDDRWQDALCERPSAVAIAA